ncbi:hypothetical protein JC525_08410 [Alteromonas sp. IB21]|uniref:hypothetical protein n=1 Tax=Alteromonas sp. IB21 TaxID=2779369 RepID=UPI0018E900C0|nr:hypothetical protein [Alteromonas sp. IB21]MBJ2128956.1 hypothetical protein [Alteromonas sp. IB21]
MSNKPLNWKPKPFTFFIFFSLFVCIQCVALIAQYWSHQSSIHQAVDKVERRISLDSAFLDVGNRTLNTPVNQFAIIRYLKKLNKALKEGGYPVLVKSIQTVEDDKEDFTSYSSVINAKFENAEQTITAEIRAVGTLSALSFSWTALLSSLLLTPIFSVSNKVKKKPTSLEEVIPPSPKLVINLQEKTISNGIDDKVVTLQNKPLCFYTALVKYCIEHPGVPLPPHKDVPSELLALANKSFGRLIELGHTKRKRPDFNANLDKTLSEIRAALDEVFSSFSEEKETYYPPRAQGEGSRSKQHSYAIPSIKQEDITIIGN